MKKNNLKDGLFTAKLLDCFKQSERYHMQVNTQFLNEEELSVALKFLGKKYSIHIDGGYPDARRNRIAFLYDEEYKSDIICLSAKINQKFVKITHSDVLGALMALDIDRNHFGDIFVREDMIVVFVTSTMADYVARYCNQIHKTKVDFQVSEDEYNIEQQFELQSINVASLRLDNVVSALVPCSRKEASQVLKLQKVSINHEIVEDCSKICHNNDVISISRKGRYILLDEGKISRKERHIISVKKFV